ncbi:MAG: hypothetical protein QOG67_1054 [Verrucomicrobiota bacterium]
MQFSTICITSASQPWIRRVAIGYKYNIEITAIFLYEN